MEVTLHFHDCCDEDDVFSEFSFSGATPLPSVGDGVSFYSTRNSNGEYIHDASKKVFAGIVRTIKYIYTEEGKSWDTNYKVCHVFLGVEREGSEHKREWRR